MKYICRKCNSEFNDVKCFADLEEIQVSRCGGERGGFHRVIGVIN